MTTAELHWTVEEASRWLTCPQPVPLKLLRTLGKDCSMVCRIHHVAWVDKPVTGKEWATERAYPKDVIKLVFEANPETKAFISENKS